VQSLIDHCYVNFVVIFFQYLIAFLEKDEGTEQKSSSSGFTKNYAHSQACIPTPAMPQRKRSQAQLAVALRWRLARSQTNDSSSTQHKNHYGTLLQE